MQRMTAAKHDIQRPGILMTGPLPEPAMRVLRKRYDVRVYDGPLPMPRDKLLDSIGDAAGLVCYPFDVIDAGVIDAAPGLTVISTYSVGFDHIDVKHARSRGVAVGYTPDVLTDATADLAIALMLDVTRRVSEGDRIIRKGDWRRVYGATDYLGYGMQGKVLGILGMGRIGRAVAGRATAFGMRVTYHNRRRLSNADEDEIDAQYVEFSRLVSESDVISIHVPYNDETHHMFDCTIFSKMKRSSFLINTSRGRVVSECDLVDALRRGDIAGAGLDVFESEPVLGTNPLVDVPNVVMAPHIGSSTVETRTAMADLAVQNLDLGMSGQKPACSVW